MSAADDFAKAMLDAQDTWSVLLDAIDGYRAECLRRGYSSAVVDSMTRDYHRMLLFGGGKS